MKYLTIEEAERIAGKKLDRRKKYYLFDIGVGRGEEVCFDAKWLDSCSGCCEMEMGICLCGDWDEKREMWVGLGCRECGYTGVIRRSAPEPVVI